MPHACFAVAGPVAGGRPALTNLPWVIEEPALQAALGLQSVRLLNDVEAMAAAVPHLRVHRRAHPTGGGRRWRAGPSRSSPPGTGLGEAFLTWDGSRYHAHASEGSHNDFGPNTPREVDLLRYLQARWAR